MKGGVVNSPSVDPFAVLETEVAKQAAEIEAAKRLATTRAKLILGRDAKSAFFATLALRLKLVVDWTCETMTTDGKTLHYHPKFVIGLSPDELLGVVVHEVMHNALSHPFRRGGRDPERWNIACDLAVNPLLLETGFVLPPSCLVPGEGPYVSLPTGKSADEYYGLLDIPQEEASNCSSETAASYPDPGGCGSVMEPDPGDRSLSESIAAEWQVAMLQAEQIAQSRGEMPSGLQRTVEAIQHPPVDWREVLQAFVSASARNDYSWSRPNRRFLWQGLYLPGLHSEELGEIVIAIDTSGSVGTRELGQFTTEANAILGAFDCSATVLYHETEVQHVQTWRSSDGPLSLEPIGGGGTSHRCVFDWLDHEAMMPSCVICLTDLQTRFPERMPMMPVLWAIIGNNPMVPPFGFCVQVVG